MEAIMYPVLPKQRQQQHRFYFKYSSFLLLRPDPDCFILGGYVSLEVVYEVCGAVDGTGVRQLVTVVLEPQEQVIQTLQLLNVIIGGQGEVQQHSDLRGRERRIGEPTAGVKSC